METEQVEVVSTPAPRVRKSSFDVATITAILVTGVLATIAFIPSATLPFLYTKVSVVALGVLVTLVLYILARLTRGNAIVPPLPLLGALWLVPLAYLLSALFSGVGVSRGFFGVNLESDTLGFMLILAAVATLTALSFRRVASYRLFFKVGALLAVAVIAMQVVFLFLSKIVPTKIAATTNLLGAFSDLGMFVGLAVILALLAHRTFKPSKKIKITLLVAVGFGLLVLALANSVVIWSLVALASLGLFIEAIMKHRTPGNDDDLDGVAMMLSEQEVGETETTSQSSLAAPLAVLAVSLFFIIGGSTIGNAVVSAFNANVIDARPSWQSTFNIGSHVYASSPIFGSGPATFDTDWVKFRDRSLNDTPFWNVDFNSGVGFIPTSFVTTGIIGALAWIAFIALLLFFGLRMLLLRSPEEPYVKFASLASFTGLAYILALAVVAVPGPIVLLVGFLLLGIFVSTVRYSADAREWGIIFARSPKVGFVIVFSLTILLLASILASYVVVERYLANVSFNQATLALNEGRLNDADAAAARSVLFAPSDQAYQVQTAVEIARMRAISADTTLSASDAQQQFQDSLSKAIANALSATQIAPNNYQNWMLLGNVYALVVPLKIEGSYENAKTAYERAATLTPTNPVLPFTLAQLELAKQDAVAAEAHLIEAIALKRDYTQAIFLFSQIEAQLGKAKEALQAAEAAAYFAPNDPSVVFQVGILRSANGDTAGAIVALNRAVDLNPQFANAHFFLGVMYAISGDYVKSAASLQTVAEFSPENAKAVADDLAAVRNGKNPFPKSRLGALGISGTVTEPAGAAKAPTP